MKKILLTMLLLTNLLFAAMPVQSLCTNTIMCPTKFCKNQSLSLSKIKLWIWDDINDELVFQNEIDLNLEDCTEYQSLFSNRVYKSEFIYTNSSYSHDLMFETRFRNQIIYG